MVTSSRAASAFSARYDKAVFSLVQASISAVKLVFTFSASDALNWNLDSAFLSQSPEPTAESWPQTIEFPVLWLHPTYNISSFNFMADYKIQVPSALQANNTWHLGANVYQTEFYKEIGSF